MKPTRYFSNVKVNAPILNLLVTNPYMDKVPIKNIYPQWKGESIEDLKQHRDNPYLLRIGTPNIDEHLKADHAFFIQSYLSYNPVTKDIEKRELIPYRNVEKVYIGKQSLEEKTFRDYTLFVNGVVMVKDVMTIDTRISFTQTVRELQQKIDLLTKEMATLKLQLQKQTIYNQ
jgi:hypothetical protein